MKRLSCCIAGEGPAARACAAALLEAGHELAAVLSDDDALGQWAERHAVPRWRRGGDAPPRRETAVDASFTIFPAAPLPWWWGAVASGTAFVVHGAGSPGTRPEVAAVEAIVSAAPVLPVCWYDGSGDIVHTANVLVQAADTAGSLLDRVEAEVVETFLDLTAALARGESLQRRPAGADVVLPPDVLLLDPAATPERVQRVLRALQFGARDNPVALPRVRVGGRTLVAAGGSAVLTGVRSLAGEELQDLALADCERPAEDELECARQAVDCDAFHAAALARTRDTQPLAMLLRPARPEQNAVTSSGHGWQERLALEAPANEVVAAFCAFVLRMTGSEGATVAVQPRRPAPSDLFSGVLPLTLDAGAAEPFAAFAVRVGDELAALERHGLFANDIFLRRPGLSGKRDWPTRAAAGIRFDDGPPIAALELIVGETELVLRADASLVTRDALARTAGNLQALFEAARPETAFGALPLAGTAERACLEAHARGADVEVEDVPIHRLFERQARSTPGAVALRFEGLSVTYAELDARASSLAAELCRRGLRDGDLVGLCLERSIELYVAVYAVWKAGAAFVPLDTESPDERLAAMIDEAAPALILTHRPVAGRRPLLAALPLPVLSIDELVLPPGDAPVVHHPDALAYVIFTSGSTGRPKGVAVGHRGLVNRIDWMQRRYGIGPGDRVLHKTPVTFDVSVWELTWPLVTGATVVIALPGGHRDPAYLVETIEREEITDVHFVPAMFRLFLAADGVAGLRKLRRVYCSGEGLPTELSRRFASLLPSCALFNLYGPTEASIDVSDWQCQPSDAERFSVTPIGTPIQNVSLHVLGTGRELLPAGAAGDLYIAGVALARGYLRRPELTEGAFLDIAIPGAAGRRMYRTGDRARWTTDGVLEYLGRTDDQVKIRGIRVELGEIEARLADHPAVRACAVTAPVRDGDRELVAFVTLSRSLDGAALAEWLRRHLPEALVPSRFVILEALPLSPNGKVDRRALIVPAEESVAPEEPLSDGERVLARLWCSVLRRGRVRPSDNFFTLGGNSLLAGQLLLEIRRELSLALTFRTLFENPTLMQLAAVLRPGSGAAEPVLAGIEVEEF
ncbi:MAG TPA: amino acid adenylation domain-containing protein [Thermoanaerobaculia bacterium]|nr:amino acid adenylation domain-containing protein [Thermoanaerobaculia bacterium]